MNRMKLQTLHTINSSLAENDQLSDENLKILNDYFEWALSDESDSDAEDYTLGKYASRWNGMASAIDFKLDEATREDLIELVSDINDGKVRKENGEDYGADSKEGQIKQLKNFYNNFIGVKGRGYESELDGPVMIYNLNYNGDTPNRKVDPENKPTPEMVKEVAQSFDELRDRAIVLFCFSLGCRVGEVFPTQDKPKGLTWDRINLHKNHSLMTVELLENRKKEDNEEREVVIPNSKPIMRKLRDKQNPDPEDPVFPKQDNRFYCPECGKKVNQINKATFENRRYECPECEWEGRSRDCRAENESISDRRVRDILKKGVQQANLEGVNDRDIVDTPHAFFRKGRALNLQALNWDDNPLRDTLGWAESSSSPARYKKALKINQKQQHAETHPHLDIPIDGRFYSKALQPIKCGECEMLNSPIWDFCRNCDQELTYEGLIMRGNSPETEVNNIKHEAKDSVIMKLGEKAGMEVDEVRNEIETTMEETLEQKGYK